MSLRDRFERHGLSAHLAAFEARHVQLSDLPELTEDDLRLEFGLVSFMDRKRFRAMVAELTGAGAPVPSLPGATTLADDAPPALSLSGATTLGDNAPPALSLSGATSLAPPTSELSLAGATRGVTVMGRSVSASSLDLAALPAGTVFDGRYTIVDLLGRGGMGAVYQAVDRDTRAVVALKTLPTGDKRLLEALANEVQLATRLQHPNLLGVRHLETRGDAPYVVMELLDDGDLESLLRARGGRLDAEEAVRVLEGLLSGLSALHGAQVAHLDVKPANVLLGKDGRVKLADFGISSRMRDQRVGSSGAATPEYAPPEQVRGEPCDARADVYAAGMLAHVLLTGGFPFDARDAAGVRAWHDAGPRNFAGVDAAVGQVLARALAVRPEDRHRGAEELRVALQKALTRKRWFVLAPGVADSLRGRVASEVRVVGSDAVLPDADALLAAHAAYPGWETVAGVVQLWTTPLAACFAGREVAGDAAHDAGVRALRGDTEALERLGQQPSQVEAALALAASMGGDANLALRRLAMAEASATTTVDHLAVGVAILGTGGRADEARRTMERAERSARAVTEHAAVAATAQACFGERATAVRALLAAERASKAAADHLAVAQAQLSVANDPRACGLALERYAEASKHAAQALIDAARAVGPHPALRTWAERLEWGAGDDVEALEAVRSAWSALGDAESEARSAAARVGSLERQVEALLERLTTLGMKGKRPEVVITVNWVAKLRATVEEQERLHREAMSLDARLVKLGLPAETWSKPYTGTVHAMRRAWVVEQEEFERVAATLDARSAMMGLPAGEWSRPYTAAALKARAAWVGSEQAFHERAVALDLEAMALGIGTEPWERPYRETALTSRDALLQPQRALAQQAATIDARRAALALPPERWTLPVSRSSLDSARATVEQWAEWSRAVSDIRVASEHEFGWAPLEPPRPHDENTVASLGAEVERQRAFQTRIAAARGGKAPAFPRHEAAVKAYEVRAARLRRIRRGTASVGVIGAIVVAVLQVQERRLELEREEARLALEPTRRAKNWTSPTFGTMQWVPPGRFTMGSPADEEHRGTDEKQHQVELTDGFWLMEHEVTQSEWRAVMNSNPSRFRGWASAPVENVSWEDVVEFAHRASSKDGVLYALPTEAQWEYAARAGQAFVYAGSNDLDAVAWTAENAAASTHEVCKKQRNGFGLCDMSGNVWEWTGDWYARHNVQGDGRNPTGPSEGRQRVLRGGAWNVNGVVARVAWRNAAEPGPGYRDFSYGVRLARVSSHVSASTGYELFPVTLGNFAMGAYGHCRDSYINQAFAMGAKEVTQAQWLAVMGSTPPVSAEEFRDLPVIDPSYPVHHISWCDAVVFANELSKQDGLAPAYSLPHGMAAYLPEEECDKLAPQITINAGAEGYRLPTEAEWERSAHGRYVSDRCQSGSTWSGTRVEKDVCKYANIADTSMRAHVANHQIALDVDVSQCNDYSAGIAPVGTYLPNTNGMFDMSGNVAEWCWNTYGAGMDDNHVDPSGGPGTRPERVVRGGAWLDAATHAQATRRSRAKPGVRSAVIGLRLAKSLP